MNRQKNRAEHALFRSISDDRTDWLFVILSDDGWSIRCDGAQVAAGTGETASITTGVEMFRSFAANAAPQSAVLSA